MRAAGGLPILACVCGLVLIGVAVAAESDAVLRVCADGNNLPLSNSRGEGYENKIAEEIARDLERRVEYTYFPQRMGFVRNTLRQRDPETKEFKCDVIIGVPAKYEITATTRPYMRSTYALVYRARPELQNLKTAEDLLKLPKNKVRELRIGVFGHSPGADWLLRNGLLDRAVFFPEQTGDPNEGPAVIIERALAAEQMDAAIVWGPMAGMLVRRHAAFPAWQAVPFTPEKQIRFDFEIAMGVRFGEKEWKDTLDRWIAENQAEIDAILASYRVPKVDASGNVKSNFRSDEDVRASSVPKEIPLRLEQN
jgi:quinoprotein dehydrogenase-associated probable ABC transporter substrate-binding protein